MIAGLVVTAFLAFANTVSAQQAVELSEAEKAWIAANPVLKVGNETDWPPYDFATDGEPLGYSIDFVRLVGARTGLELEFVNGHPWAELLSMLKNGELDILPALYDTRERRDFAAFTIPYLSEPSVIVLRKDNDDIKNLSDLSGRTLATIKGSAATGALAEKFPEINLLLVDGVMDGVAAVSRRKADAMLNSVGSLSYVVQTTHMPDVKFIADPALRAVENPALHMAVPKDRAILRDILNKGFVTVSDAELSALRATWLPLEVTFATAKDPSDFDRRIIPGIVVAVVLIAAGVFAVVQYRAEKSS